MLHQIKMTDAKFSDQIASSSPRSQQQGERSPEFNQHHGTDDESDASRVEIVESHELSAINILERRIQNNLHDPDQSDQERACREMNIER